ncbi:selenocysteine-specific translation elongation factor [Patulibacter americanus]|uniref:selenocysteine-specific translation elongation factor n=1 Tax=Patulibacter americanus TaxID=588672 RepID=UPI0003B634A8|nr:selenocysteine-specific translation elongation factor [Patulibacter americanus]
MPDAARAPVAGGDGDAPAPAAGPLVLGTAGHIDHGKTALVGALTGTDTDRLPEERERGISIALGYARLPLPSGRVLSLVDVPGHERFVRTMVAGATGIDLFLMVVAADDGVMPQTVEHAEVLRGLGVSRGVVVVTKADLADPADAAAQAAELLPGCEVVACSARTGQGLDDVVAALERLADGVPGRDTSGRDTSGPAGRRAVVDARASAGLAPADEPPVLHVDRVFTVAGRGTVVTGTLWSGVLATGATLELSPGARAVRVRGIEVHGRAQDRAGAGQRVAVALGGVRRRDVARGDVLATPGARVERTVLDCALDLREPRHGERVHVHHGTRESPGRLSHLEDDLFQLRLDRPLMAVDGDRVVVRRPSPAGTLGGGVVLDAAARRHGRRPDVLARLRRLRDGEPEPVAAPAPTPEPAPVPSAVVAPSAAALALEARLLEAGLAFPSEAALDAPAALGELLERGRAVRVSGRLVGHADTVAAARDRILALLTAEGSTSLAEVRDLLGTSRKPAQALLEHLDAQRLTLRRPDDRRVPTRRALALTGSDA